MNENTHRLFSIRNRGIHPIWDRGGGVKSKDPFYFGVSQATRILKIRRTANMKPQTWKKGDGQERTGHWTTLALGRDGMNEWIMNDKGNQYSESSFISFPKKTTWNVRHSSRQQSPVTSLPPSTVSCWFSPGPPRSHRMCIHSTEERALDTNGILARNCYYANFRSIL